MTHTDTHNIWRASAIGSAIASLLLATSAQAGKIDNLNNNPAKPGACVAIDNPATMEDESTQSPAACVGAWNLDNVDVKLVKTATNVETDFFDKVTGVYTAMTYGDSFVSIIKNAAGSIVARLTGKDWPVGEPTGIKAVNDDGNVKNGKPKNCLINTAYLGENPDVIGDVDQYLDDNPANPVLCSSFFQSHKRFKIAMQPATVEGVADGDPSDKPIDLLFNVTDNGSLTPYQVFSKINNYTGKRLKGYKIVVGKTDAMTGVFQSATDLGIANKLHISLGIDEGWSSGMGAAPDSSNLFESDGLATFSHGLFGPKDTTDPIHFPENGFFDTRSAGFEVTPTCTLANAEVACSYLPVDPAVSPDALMASDTIKSGSPLASNYTTLFGDWLPSKWQPSGVFYDDDNDPTTDAQLKAWWNGSQWVGNNDSVFAPIPAATLAAWGKDPLYSVSKIEDVLNLGINYIVKVGDGIGPNFTIRIIPVVATNQDAPTFLAAEPAPLSAPATTPATTYTGGGGCSAADGKQPVDPMLPLFAALGLAGWAMRRRAARRS